MQQGFDLELNAGVGKATSSACYSQHVLIRSHRSVEGHAGGETYRIFIAEDGCGYALLRLKHDNGSGWLSVTHATVAGFLNGSGSTSCPTWTVELFQAEYNAFHSRLSVESSSTASPTTSRALPSNILALVVAGSVIVLLLALLVALTVHRRRHLSTVNVSVALKRLLASARYELDELYGRTSSQEQDIAILSK